MYGIILLSRKVLHMAEENKNKNETNIESNRLGQQQNIMQLDSVLSGVLSFILCRLSAGTGAQSRVNWISICFPLYTNCNKIYNFTCDRYVCL